MPNIIDKAIGIMPEHLSVYGKRSSLLASNIANANTPGYKARDIDFRAALAQAGGEQMALKTTRGNHIADAGSTMSGPEILYRTPLQPSLDGNTVDSQQEKARFTENAIRYQSTLTFLGGKFTSLKLAIKGE
ncbi:flagellar basal-body rod protein FlgB [Thiogranum longum]|uniref:Flagellar basal body rod protein FlgB n=1 Tax=Thiogranum longum TaxID=1537524 RepID=A0A4R1HDS4_9GAMM|nr:flagellar basal body rod protein FlgB [Thiogranum longum]TCK18871.1 flagellar basal-body rod protein FlgB [Thiogranum longum]